MWVLQQSHSQGRARRSCAKKQQMGQNNDRRRLRTAGCRHVVKILLECLKYFVCCKHDVPQGQPHWAFFAQPRISAAQRFHGRRTGCPSRFSPTSKYFNPRRMKTDSHRWGQASRLSGLTSAWKPLVLRRWPPSLSWPPAHAPLEPDMSARPPDSTR